MDAPPAGVSREAISSCSVAVSNSVVTRWSFAKDSGLTAGSTFGPNDSAAEAELLAGLPFINLELVDQAAFQQLTERTFASDRNLVAKGMLEVCS